MLAVAGSGKTSFLIDRLNLEERFLLVTYTINNHDHLQKSILHKFGYIPSNIKVLRYFQFLYYFCFKPFFGMRSKVQGITFNLPPENTRYKIGSKEYYMTSGRMFYHNRLARFCQEYCAQDIKDRLDKYYDYFFIDEVQDIAGHDFNLLLAIIPNQCDSLFVGDFYQHTFDTSYDGQTNISLYNDYGKYIKRWQKGGVIIDTASLCKTHRCSKQICEFVCKMGIAIKSTEVAQGNVHYITNEQESDSILMNPLIPKLFYECSHDYNCNAINWGASKGINDFVDVCVILNKSTDDLFRNNRLQKMNPRTKNKLYVACTRPHRHLYIIPSRLAKKFKKTN